MTKRYLRTPEEVIDALQDKKTLTDGRTTWKVYKGWVVRSCNRNIWSVGESITSCNDVYIEEPEPLKLEVGKFYKTRDGRKAWVVDGTDIKGAFPFMVVTQKECNVYRVTKDGRRFFENTDGTDLVAPWEE